MFFTFKRFIMAYSIKYRAILTVFTEYLLDGFWDYRI